MPFPAILLKLKEIQSSKKINLHLEHRKAESHNARRWAGTCVSNLTQEEVQSDDQLHNDQLP